MALNLVGLIKASGGAGVSGQTFRSNVKPFTGMDGKSMQSYRVTAMQFDSGGIPALPGETNPYSTGDVFDVTATITRNANAFEIQSLLQSAWTLTLTTISGQSDGMSAAFSSFSQTGGTSFQLGIQVTAPLAGSPAPSVGVTANGSRPVDYGQEWTGTYVTSVTSTASGTSDLDLKIEYRADPYFNVAVNNLNGSNQGWRFRITNRSYTTADIEFRAWNVEAGADAINNNGRLNGEGPWSWTSYGSNHPNNVNVPIWWRWRVRGTTTWSAKQGPVAPNDTRQGA